MNKRVLLLLGVVLAVVSLVPTVFAQDPYSTDSDGDGLVDAFDACPNEPGPDFNYGCPDGVVPPDNDADGIPNIVDVCPDQFGFPEFGGCPDTDGDGVDDSYDNCPTEIGLTQNYGCSFGVPRDADQDGILDGQDRCAFTAGVPERNGCPADFTEDFDNDGVIDDADSCIDQSAPGTADNAGCAPGITPDFDFDTVADANDACPYEFGTAPNGCLQDADGDYLPDNSDACPDQAGDSRNVGCPDQVVPPDSDQDGVIDLYDRCPFETGVNFSDCPDNDGDSIPDIDDQCPTQAGDPILGGCEPIAEATLNPNRPAITTQNVANITELGRLVRPSYAALLGNNSLLAVQAYGEPTTLYNINDATIRPIGSLESGNGESAMAANGSVLAELNYNTTGAPTLTIWNPETALAVFIQLNNLANVSGLDVRADGEVIAVSSGDEPFSLPVDNPTIQLYGRDGSLLNEYTNLNASPNQIVLDPNGTWLAYGARSTTTILNIADGSTIATLPVGSFFLGFDALAVSPDGTLLAIGDENGVVTVFETATFTQVYSVPVVNFTPFDAVRSVNFSPDGQLIATTGGTFIDGPQPADAAAAFTIVDANTGAILLQVETVFTANAAQFSSDMRTLVIDTFNVIQFYGIN